MTILWCAVCALCAAWFTGDAILGLLVAPNLFEIARTVGPGDAFAGLVFGELLGRWVAIAGLVCVIPCVCLLAAAAGRALKQRGVRAAWLPLICSLLLLSAHVVSTTTVRYGLDQAAALRQHPDPIAMDDFRGRFHARSKLILSAEMLTALAVAIGAAVAARRTARRPLPA